MKKCIVGINGDHRQEVIAELDSETNRVTIIEGYSPPDEPGLPAMTPGHSFLYGDGYESPLEPNQRYWQELLTFNSTEWFVLGSDPNGKESVSKTDAG